MPLIGDCSSAKENELQRLFRSFGGPNGWPWHILLLLHRARMHRVDSAMAVPTGDGIVIPRGIRRLLPGR